MHHGTQPSAHRHVGAPQVEQHFSGQEQPEDRAIPQRVQLLCAAAAFDTALGRCKLDRGARNEVLARAGGLLSQARALDFHDQLPSLGSAQLSLAKVPHILQEAMQIERLLALRIRHQCTWHMLTEAFAKHGPVSPLPSMCCCQQGDVEGAKREYERALKQAAGGQQNIAPLVGLAMLAYNQGNYGAALGMCVKTGPCIVTWPSATSVAWLMPCHMVRQPACRSRSACADQRPTVTMRAILSLRFRKALRLHPGAPAELRLGIGAAAFKLGRLDVARAAFRRALQLQPRCVPALTGLAVLAMHAAPSGNVSRHRLGSGLPSPPCSCHALLLHVWSPAPCAAPMSPTDGGDGL